jgi:hypothetical protein
MGGQLQHTKARVSHVSTNAKLSGNIERSPMVQMLRGPEHANNNNEELARGWGGDGGAKANASGQYNEWRCSQCQHDDG